jgi:NADP-dependent 3-hydroxy acid dehydrogenase YdfG
LVGDIGRAEDVSRIVDETLRTYGRVDVLVNNAAIGIFKLVVDTTVDEFDAMWTTNMRGLFLMTKAVLPTMMKQASGAIVNISSLAGKNGVKGGAVYAATKWAVRGFAKSLMLEIRDRKIRVVTIFPGSVDTSFSSSNRRRPSITQPDDVAEAVVFAITTPIRTMVSEVDLRPTIPP